MKKILIIDHDQKFIGNLQTQLVQRFEILATEDYRIAYRIINSLPIDLVMARLPLPTLEKQVGRLKKLLVKLQKKKFSEVTRILLATEGAEHQVDEFLKLGIAAVVMDVEEAMKWLN